MKEKRRNWYIDDVEDVEWSTLTPDRFDGVWSKSADDMEDEVLKGTA